MESDDAHLHLRGNAPSGKSWLIQSERIQTESISHQQICIWAMIPRPSCIANQRVPIWEPLRLLQVSCRQKTSVPNRNIAKSFVLDGRLSVAVVWPCMRRLAVLSPSCFVFTCRQPAPLQASDTMFSFCASLVCPFRSSNMTCLKKHEATHSFQLYMVATLFLEKRSNLAPSSTCPLYKPFGW